MLTGIYFAHPVPETRTKQAHTILFINYPKERSMKDSSNPNNIQYYSQCILLCH